MADLKKCDKCGCIRKPSATQSIVIYPYGENDSQGKTYWHGEELNNTAIRQDLCLNCGKDFIEKTYQYFHIKQKKGTLN